MDPNANALGANPQPAAPTDGQTTPPAAPAAPAPDGQLVNPPAPEQGQTPTPGTDGGLQLDADTLKFLENQNIDASDPAKAIAALAKRNEELRSRKPEDTPTKGNSKEVLDVLNGTAPVETPPATPKAPEQPATPPSRKGPDDKEIAVTSLIVKNTYKDVDVNAQFYKDMIADGFQPVNADGSLRLQNVLNYAAYKQKLADADKAIAAAQPNPNGIPDPSNVVEQFADVTPIPTMDKRAAQNIILFSDKERAAGRPVHPQLSDAQKYLRDHAFDK